MRLENVVVEAASTKPVKTRYGMKSTYSFKAGGEWFNANFKNPKVDKGDVISFNYEEDSYGKAVDVDTISKGASVAPPIPAASSAGKADAPRFTGGKRVFPIPALDGQRAIVRQNAVTNARELVAAVLGKDSAAVKLNTKQMDVLTDEIIRIARKLEAYSCGDLDMEEVKAEMASDEKKAA